MYSMYARFYGAIFVIMADEHKASERAIVEFRLSEAAQLLTKAEALLAETNDSGNNSGSRDR